MSESLGGSSLGQGAGSLQQAGWSAKLEAAQAARQEQAVQQSAAALQGGKARGMDAAELAKLRKVSQDFESVFLAYLMRSGRQSVPKGGWLGETPGEKIFTEMRDDELAKRMSQAGGIGLSRLLMEQLTRSLQQQQRPQSAAPGSAPAA